MATSVRKTLSAQEVNVLRRRNFTITDSTVSGGSDDTILKVVVGGRYKLRLMKRRGIRA